MSFFSQKICHIANYILTLQANLKNINNKNMRIELNIEELALITASLIARSVELSKKGEHLKANEYSRLVDYIQNQYIQEY